MKHVIIGAADRMDQVKSNANAGFAVRGWKSK